MKKMRQAKLVGREWCGAASDGLVNARTLAIEAWGERANDPNSGLLAFAYLWRRFGPPKGGWDEYKDLVGYDLETADPDVVLTLYPSGSALALKVGYLATREVHEGQYEPAFREAFRWGDPWREGPPLARRVNQALFDAMRRLLKPVSVRDVEIDLFGRVERNASEATR